MKRTIIQFPENRISHTNDYNNLIALFTVCDSVESCNFYLETVEELSRNGNITEKEMYTLRRIGRQKRLELATPKQEPKKAEAPGQYNYTPEMGEVKPQECQMDARLDYYGKHIYIDTPIELKGRGITFLKKYKPGDLLTHEKDGWNNYQVTKLAYQKLKEQYSISYKCYLD